MASVERPCMVTDVGVTLIASSVLHASIPTIGPYYALMQAAIGIALIKNVFRDRKWAWTALQGVSLGNAFLVLRLFEAYPVLVIIFFPCLLIPIFLLRRRESRAYFGVIVRARDGVVSTVQTTKKYRRTLERIERFTAKGKLEKGLILCRGIIEDLSGLKDVTSEFRSCLGQAHLAQGRIFRQQDRAWDAAQVYLTARLYISLPDEALSFLAIQLAARKEESEKGVEVYLEYLRLRRNIPEAGSDDSVFAILQSMCLIEEDATHERLSSVQILCRKVLEANDGLEWAQFSLGRSLFESGDQEGALCCFEGSLRLRPDRIEAAYFATLCQGSLKESKGTREEALGLYREAVRLIVDRPEAHCFIAKILVSNCEEIEVQDAPDVAARIALLAAEAKGAIVTAVSRRPKCSQYHYFLGRVLSFSGESRVAIEAYRKAIDIFPQEKLYHLHLAIELGRLSEIDVALQVVERGLSLDRDYSDAYRVMGDLLGIAGRYPLADVKYRKAINLRPGDGRARLGLSRTLYCLGRFEEAVAELKQVMPRTREVAYLLARSCSCMGHFSLAIPILEKLATRTDAVADTFYYLGCARANTGQFITASDAFGACLDREATRWQAHLQRGHCHLALRKYGEAVADYEKVREFNPDCPEASIGIAQCHLFSGCAEAARPLVEQTVQSHPTSWEGHMILGILAEKADDFAAAEKSYATALEIRPEHPESCARLGFMFCRQERYPEACINLQRAAGAGHETDAVLFSLGYAQAGRGDYDDAIGTWRKLQQRHPEDQRLALNIDRLYYLKGRRHVEEEKYEEAITAWQEYVKMRPDDEKLKRDIAELYFRLGLTRMGVGGSREEARRNLLSAMEADGSHGCASFYIAILDLIDGQEAKATKQFSDLSKNGTPSMRYRALYYQGISLLHQGDNGRAVKVLRSAADDPRRAEMDLPVNFALALAFARKGDWKESLAVLQPMMQ